MLPVAGSAAVAFPLSPHRLTCRRAHCPWARQRPTGCWPWVRACTKSITGKMVGDDRAPLPGTRRPCHWRKPLVRLAARSRSGPKAPAMRLHASLFTRPIDPSPRRDQPCAFCKRGAGLRGPFWRRRTVAEGVSRACLRHHQAGWRCRPPMPSAPRPATPAQSHPSKLLCRCRPLLLSSLHQRNLFHAIQPPAHSCPHDAVSLDPARRPVLDSPGAPYARQPLARPPRRAVPFTRAHQPGRPVAPLVDLAPARLTRAVAAELTPVSGLVPRPRPRPRPRSRRRRERRLLLRAGHSLERGHEDTDVQRDHGTGEYPMRRAAE